MVRGSYIKHREIDKIQPVLAFAKKLNASMMLKRIKFSSCFRKNMDDEYVVDQEKI